MLQNLFFGTLNMPEKLYEDLRNASPKYIDNLVAAKDDLEAMFARNREVIAEVHDHVNTIIDQTFVAAERAGMGHAEFVALTCVSIGGFAKQVAEEADRMKGFAGFMAKSAASGLLDDLVKAAKYEAKAIEEKLMKAMNADNPVFRVSMPPIL